ncbi:MAG: DUF2202 domain-containing protein [Halanaerobiales bacterium]|nr:DUF2202 domain-containing protein [Halanaerobiales bacterium]
MQEIFDRKKIWFLIITMLISLLIGSIVVLAEDNYGAMGAKHAEDYTLEEMLIYAIQDEYLARTEYDLIMNQYGVQRPFSNIIKAEEHHIELLKPLFEKYNISIPEDNSSEYVVLPEDIREALQIGVNAEIDNIEMYESFLTKDIPADVAFVFEELKRGSENHLRAFKNSLNRNDGFGQGYKGK